MQFSEFRNKVGPALQASDLNWFQAGKCKRADTGHRQDAGARGTKLSSADWQCAMQIMLFTVYKRIGQFRRDYTPVFPESSGILDFNLDLR